MTSLYAVTDPATGELVVESPTIGDKELRDAIGTLLADAGRASQALRKR
jgi:hypothetical protein